MEFTASQSKDSSTEVIEKAKFESKEKETVIDRLKSHQSTLEKQIASKDERYKIKHYPLSLAFTCNTAKRKLGRLQFSTSSSFVKI